MHDLQPITPLGDSTPRVDHIGAITLSEIVDTALASVAARLGQDEQTRALLADLLGAPAPAPGRAVFGAPGAFWSGPDQWMIEADNEALATDLAARAKGCASITEQNGAWCRFDLTGSGLADVFERLCPIDVRSMHGGEASRSTIEHLGCFVICRTPEHFSVLGPRSSAGSLHHALLAAIRSVQ